MTLYISYKIDSKEIHYILEKKKTSLGRASGNDVVIPDISVSRHHAEIIKEGDTFRIKDLDSKNGTFLNSKKIKESIIESGDTIKLGKFEIKVSQRESEVEITEEADSWVTMIKSVDEVSPLIKGEIVEKEKIKLLGGILKFGKSLISIKNQEEILKYLVNSIFELTPSERVSILLLSKENNSLEPIIFLQKVERERKLSLSKTIVNKSINEKVAILFSGSSIDHRFDEAESIRIYGIKSAISVPLWIEDSVLGLIYADSRDERNKLSNEHLEILSILANYAGIALHEFDLTQKLAEEIKMREKLERYHSPGIVSRLMELTQQKLGFSEKDVSVLFLDIVGFTSISEELEPSEVGLLLNYFFSEMTEIIFENEGTLDKYLGDGLMAIFGAPFSQINHAERAAKTGLEMIRKTKKINMESAFKKEIKVRIGINSGKAIVGDFGSLKRMEYTCIGDTVNLASRFQNAIAEPNQLIIGENTYNLIRDKFKTNFLGERKIEGIKRYVRVWEVVE
ncbi:MAG: adenylate/guanylate cyclase domain-containing protein [Acidobacteriota bacterium]